MSLPSLTTFATGLLIFSITTCAIYSLLQFRFLAHCRRFLKRRNSENYLPKAGVILCLRGADHTLYAGLESLLNQDYPDYTVKIIVDSDSDPAMELLEDLERRRDYGDRMQISVLETPRRDCSLKCSSLVQGVQELGDSIEVIALMDADVVPHATWLRELVAPLADKSVGAAFGNRWFLPWQGSAVAAARAAWICCTDVVMQQTGLCWGGSLAIRREVFEQADIAEAWSHSFNDDILLGDLVRKQGLQTCFVPSLLAVHEEPCRLVPLVEFVRRQLIHTRLSHSLWPLVATIGYSVSGIVPASILLSVAGLATGNWLAALYSAGALAVYLTVMSVYYRMIETAAIEATATHEQEMPRLGLQSVAGIALAAVIHFVSLISAATARSVNWRGIHYRLTHDGKVELTQYRPFAPAIPKTIEPVSKVA